MGAAPSSTAQKVDWSDDNKQNLLKELNDFQPGISDVNPLRILLYGPVGAGKSSFINSVDSALQGRIKNRALADSVSGKSFTLETKEYELKMEETTLLPFTLIDTKGIEEEPGNGMKIDDIIRTGHIKNKPNIPKNEKNRTPLQDQIHCLVAVLPANTISLMVDDVIRQMREVRLIARDLDIPQVIIMTKVDEACPQVKYNIRSVNDSKKIEEQVEQCFSRLGVPMSYIYPMKNYHKEQINNTEMDILILQAMLNIVNFANDYVKDQMDKK